MGRTLIPEGTTTDRKEWLACRAATRCARGSRYVTGADIVRISRTLALEPWHFTETSPAAAGDPTGILLDEGRRRVNLRLANGPKGCVFLMTTESQARCGLGDLAPVTCRIHHTDLGEGARPAQPERGCGCESRGVPGMGMRELSEAGHQWTTDRNHWFEVVERWNAIAERSPHPLGIQDFQRYLMEAQAAREEGAGWPEEVTA